MTDDDLDMLERQAAYTTGDGGADSARVYAAVDEIRRLRAHLAQAISPKKSSVKMKIAITIIVGALSGLAMLSGILNSGIGYRQMRAIEQISERCSQGQP
jgi:hypothetical protein